MYVVGLRATGLVITTIPAIVIRPEPPTTGLNTSLTDPNGQWTATAKAKIIEKNDIYWEFSYFVDMTNRTDEEQEYTVKVHFVDADGFSVEDGYAGDVFNKIPANPPNGCWIGSLSTPKTPPQSSVFCWRSTSNKVA